MSGDESIDAIKSPREVVNAVELAMRKTPQGMHYAERLACAAIEEWEAAKAKDQPDQALSHLGDVLCMLAEMHPDHQCRAYVEALAYHNAQRPDAQVIPMEGYSSRIVTTGPLDRLLERESGGLVKKLERQIYDLQEMANQARGFLLERPCNKTKCNTTLLRMTQMKLVTDELTDIERVKQAIEQANELESQST